MTSLSEDSILVDTNVLSFFLKNPNDSRAQLYAPSLKDKILAVSFVTVGDLYRWAYQRKWGEKRLAELYDLLARKVVILEYEDIIAQRWARIPIDNRGVTLSDNDAWIAATALAYDLTLATHDKRFRDIRGLKIICHAPAKS